MKQQGRQAEKDEEDIGRLRTVMVMIWKTVEIIERELGEMDGAQKDNVGTTLMSFYVVTEDKWNPRPGRTWRELGRTLAEDYDECGPHHEKTPI